jgi:CPA2 family monovalent cation:H+ antiporter-2
VLTLQLGVALATAVVVIAVTQPFLPSYPGPVLLLLLVVAFAIAIRQSATDLQGHVRAGSQAIVEALTSYARQPGDDGNPHPSLTSVHSLLVGLGEPVAIQLEATSPSVGRSLAGLNLRGRTGATVLAIIRGGKPVVPRAEEKLENGDVLAIAGTRDAIAAATTMLRGAADDV